MMAERSCSGSIPVASAPDQAKSVSRRRVLQISAAVAGAPLLAGAFGGRSATAVPIHTWRGVALGAPASLTLCHPDRSVAHRLVAQCRAEMRRLEHVFSLFRADSEISRLNRTGRLDAPSHDMVRLLAESRRLGDLTGGAFDVTVQPLWRLYADHFGGRPDIGSGPDAKMLARARRLVDYRRIEVGTDRIRLSRRGMAITLNGIAQGYITDRVADLLRDQGMDRVLIDLGELRALGGHPAGRAWRVGVTDPFAPSTVDAPPLRRIELADGAMATSGGYGTSFDASGRHHHLFDPRTGGNPGHFASVTVIARRATIADALSTALYVMTPPSAERLCRTAPGITALFVDAGGHVFEKAFGRPAERRRDTTGGPRNGRT